MRRIVTFTIDSHGKASVIAHPCDPPELHRAAAEACKLLAYRAETTSCKRVSKPEQVVQREQKVTPRKRD